MSGIPYTFTDVGNPPILSAQVNADFAYVLANATATAVASGANLSGLGIYNVKYYGAKGDGVTDDTAAINSTFAALPTTGGTIYFPMGNYLISGAVGPGMKANVRVIGAGAGRDSVNTGAVTIQGSNAASCLDMRDADHHTIENLRFDGKSVSSYGIRQGYKAAGTHIAFAKMSRVTVQNINGTAIDTGSGNTAGSCNDSVYEDVLVETATIGYDFYSTDNSVRGGDVTGCTTAGVRLNNSSELKVYGQCVFSGNAVDIGLNPPSSGAFINGIHCYGVWFENSTNGIVKNLTSNATPVGSIDFNGCILSSSHATSFMDFTNITGSARVVGGWIPSGSSTTVVVPSGFVLVNLGASQRVSASGSGVVSNLGVDTTSNDFGATPLVVSGHTVPFDAQSASGAAAAHIERGTAVFAAATSVTIAFVTAFTSAPVVALGLDSLGVAGSTLFSYQATTTQVIIYASASFTGDVSFIAIGS